MFKSRYGFRIGVQNGRNARRIPAFSGRRGLCCQHTVCPSFRLLLLWVIVFALFMPTTLPGPRLECPEYHSCKYHQHWGDSRRWHSPCLSAVSELALHQTPWIFPAAYHQIVRVFSRIYTNTHLLGWGPLPRVCPAHLSRVALGTVTYGEELV